MENVEIVIRKANFFAIAVYLTFSVDSLLKVPFGIQIHIGILFILFFNLIFFLFGKWGLVLAAIRTNIWFFLFLIYSFLNGLLIIGVDSFRVFVYGAFAFSSFVFAVITHESFGRNTIKTFQWILIGSGLFQYGIYSLTGYQLNFLDTDHYNTLFSYAHRLRGFFVEPNWFAIMLGFNTILLIGGDFRSSFSKNRLLFLFTLLVFLFNASLGPFIVLLFAIFIDLGRRSKMLLISSFFVLSVLLLALFSIRGGFERVNYYSRVMPFIRVVEEFKHSEVCVKWFGNGLGSWGTLGVSKGLSTLVNVPDPSKRDSSEFHVFLFELGLVGLVLFLIDVCSLFNMNGKNGRTYYGLTTLYLVSFLFYPSFKFWMYMLPFFIMRIRVFSGIDNLIDHE